MKKYFVVFTMVLFCSSLTYSQNALDTLWQKTTYYDKLGNMKGFAQNPIDSNIVISCNNGSSNFLARVDSRTGKVIKIINVPTPFSSFWFLNDTNSLLVQSSNLEILNSHTFERLLYDTIQSYSVYYNKDNNRAITSYESSIRIIDTENKKIVKEYNSNNHFDRPDISIFRSVISNYNNYVIYNSDTQLSSSPPYPSISQLVVLDSNGKIIYIDEKAISKGFGDPTTSLSLSNDQKLIAYCTSENYNTIKILDLTTLKVIKSVSINGVRPRMLKFSPDDKLLFLGSESGLMYFDLENWKRKWITDDGVIDNFNFDLFNPNIIYINLGGLFQAFRINGLTSVINDNPINNTFNANYIPTQHSLNLNMNLVNNGNLMVTLYNISGSPLMVLENNLFQLGESNKTYNMNNFPQGAYYLQIKLNNEIIYPALNFIKVN